MSKKNVPIDNFPHDRPPSVRPGSLATRQPAPASSPRLRAVAKNVVPEVTHVRTTATTEERLDARVLTAVATLGRTGDDVEASNVATYAGTPVDDVLDALERLIDRKLLKLVGGAPVRVQVVK
jgi:hypothetical protein